MKTIHEHCEVIRRLELIADLELRKRNQAKPDTLEYYTANRKYADATLMIQFYMDKSSPFFNKEIK